MAIIWKEIKNNAQTTLAANLDQASLTMTVVDANELPTAFPSYATVWDKIAYPNNPSNDPNMEIISIDSLSAPNILNVTRGQDGTNDVGHSSGNTVANLFNAATLTEVRDEIDKTDYAQIVDVDPTNGDYQTIKDAVNSITDSSSSKMYVVKVHPGVYTEDNPITLPAFVSVIGDQQRAIVVKPSNNNANVFIMGNSGEINNVSIDGTGTTGVTAIYAADASIVKCRIGNLSLKNCVTGVLLDNATTELYGVRINVRGIFTDVLKVTAGNMDIIDVIVGSALTATTVFKAEGANSKMIITTTSINSSTITNAVYADDNAVISIFSSQLEKITNAFRIGSSGSSEISASGVELPSSATYDLLVESATGVYEGCCVCLNRDKTSIAVGANISSFGYDHYSGKFRSLTNLAVGRDGFGKSCQFGEGGGYQHNVKVYSYNGATYTEVTTNDPIQFANVNVNTALYFGDLDSHMFYSLKYKMGDTAISLGTGSITWEYYDGGTATWVEFDTLNTRTAYSNSQNGSSFTGTNGKTYDARFDHNIESGVIESSVSATGWVINSVNGDVGYWVRCRISGAITTSPKFSGVFLKGSFVSIRPNGTMSYHGSGRPEIWGLGEFGANAAPAANRALSVSSNIDYPFKDNALINNAFDKLYWRIPVDSGMDTSSGITIELELCTNKSPSTTEIAKLHFYSALMHAHDADAFDGTATEVEQAFDFTATAGDAAYLLQRYILTYRIDISVLHVGDVVYCSLQREGNESGDTLGSNVLLSNAIYKTLNWQSGIHNE